MTYLYFNKSGPGAVLTDKGGLFRSGKKNLPEDLCPGRLYTLNYNEYDDATGL